MNNFNNDINKKIFFLDNKVCTPIKIRQDINKNINPYYLKDKFFQINKNNKFYSEHNNKFIDNKNNVSKTEIYSNNLNLRDKLFNRTPPKIIRNSLDVKDINACKSSQLSKRQTNPLDPKYNYDWQMTEINENRKIKYIDFGEIGNHPKSLNFFNNQRKGNNLYTNDISGSQPGTKSHISKLEIKYGRQMSHKKEDIIGSHPGSLSKGIKTNRKTNPLNPDYPLIGGEGLEYGNEKENNYHYDYNSLLEYYKKHSKITNPDNDNNKKNFFVKEKNKESKEKEKIDSLKLNNFRNKNFLYDLGNNKKIYPREQYRNTENDNYYDKIIFEDNSNYKYDNSKDIQGINNYRENIYYLLITNN